MSVTMARGFRASGIGAGIKASGQRDLALVVNDGPSYAAAGVFTTNRFKAAPVLWSEQVLDAGTVTAVVLNSGVANSCTGPPGFQDTHATAEKVAEELGHSAAEVAVCSTGRVGVRLPRDVVMGGIEAAARELSTDGGHAAADAIRTTDTVAKTVHRLGDGYAVGGMAKGTIMLSPSLATMLCVLTTDADLAPTELGKALRAGTTATFDRLDTDGTTSTNDTTLLLASGASGVAPVFDDFATLVSDVCDELARQMVADAIDTTKRVTIDVIGAADEHDANEVARAVARNPMVKCSIHGSDPNWGRVLVATGSTDATFEPGRLAVAMNGVWVCRSGMPGDDTSLVDLSGPDVSITIDLAAGDSRATIWTTDLTPEYVRTVSVPQS